MTDFTQLYHNKKVLIWGLGLNGGGVGAARFFGSHGAEVLVIDQGEADTLAKSVAQLKDFPQIKYHFGPHQMEDFAWADIVLLNPAIKPHNEFLIKAKTMGKQIETDYGIFLKHFPGAIIGITGTKGKSTLTKMTYELTTRALEDVPISIQGRKYTKVLYGGNIKKSMFEALTAGDAETIAVLELSSFMLEQARYVERSPEISLVTNIYNEHLDWHADLAEYIAAKAHILDDQKKGDVAILGEQCEALFASYVRGVKYVYDGMPDEALKILARHLGIAETVVASTVDNFVPLYGRQDVVRELAGLTYVNDTMSTHPAAVLYSLKSLKKKAARSGQPFEAVVIMGGVDKGFGADEMLALTNFLSENKVKSVLIPGTFTDHLMQTFAPQYREQMTYPAETMVSAVTVATHAAIGGTTIILSPGAASFNMFKNATDRGDQFVAAVTALPATGAPATT